MTLRILVLVFVSSLSSGCATTVPKMADLTPVADDRRFSNQTPADGNVVVIVLRDKAFAGGGVNYRLLIDGKLAAKVAAGEFVVLYVSPGEHVIEVRHPSALLGAIGDSSTLRAEANVKYFYRINSDLGQIRLLRTTEDSAAQ